MSLYQRANSFNKKSKDIYQGSLNPSNAVQIEKVDKGSFFTKQELLSKLNDQVQKVISADKLAKIVAKSPIVAKAEIKSAAQYCYMLDFWKEVDEKIKQDLIEALIDYMFGFGPIENLINDSSITEVMVNGTNSIYYERDGKLFKTSAKFSSDEQVRSLIDRILGPLGRRIDESSPTVNARLSTGHRVHAIIPPLAMDGPVLTIRKFSEHVITLDEMIDFNSIDIKLKQFFVWAIKLRKNIAVSGGTGSGKTTLLNALSCLISHDERIITIEDSAELRFLEHPHVIRLEARPKNAEGAGEITIRDLVINALRMRPDRIVVGECRGAEALDMLQAMNTGHDGSLTTLHANSPSEAITRLTTMVRYAVELPVDVIETYIASAIDIVVQTTRGIDGKRYVSQIVEFSLDKKTNKCVVTNLFIRDALGHVKWEKNPCWIKRVIDYKFASKQEVQKWINLAA